MDRQTSMAGLSLFPTALWAPIRTIHTHDMYMNPPTYRCHKSAFMSINKSHVLLYQGRNITKLLSFPSFENIYCHPQMEVEGEKSSVTNYAFPQNSIPPYVHQQYNLLAVHCNVTDSHSQLVQVSQSVSTNNTIYLLFTVMSQTHTVSQCKCPSLSLPTIQFICCSL